MSNPELNSLLKWGVENSDASRQNETEHTPSSRGLNAETLNALLGGPSDADLMKEAMQVIRSPDVSLADKVTAFDNFEQLVENLDNANNLESLDLWTPLLEELDNPEPDMRRMAAWCVGTAVQNNVKSQERLVAMGGILKLAKLATGDKDLAVKRKSVYALSSSMRNYQPATNEAVKALPYYIVGTDNVSAEDMETIDAIMEKLRG
jgi:hsp70-interacting protein